MRNSNDIATTVSRRHLAVVSGLADLTSLRNSATQALTAPTSLNGCISDISSDAIHGCKRDYAAAMKSYGVVYAAYQSYLLPTEQRLSHDYDMAAQPAPDFSHLGCLNIDLLASTVQTDSVSDDDIESCGYMAWVHH